MSVRPLKELCAEDSQWPKDTVDFLRLCAGPTWIRQSGHDGSRVRVLTTLLHGNEPSGARAVARWLASGQKPAVDTVFFIASVEAALTEPIFSHRMLPGHPDANRTYRAPFNGQPGQLALEVLDRVEELRPEALVDLHNNTGHNPAYAVVTSTDDAVLSLTSLFAERLVHSDLNLGALIEASAAWCPSVVIECGRAGDAEADEVAWRGLQGYLSKADLELGARPSGRLEVLHHPLRVSVKPGVSLALATHRSASAALTVDLGVEGFNFRPMPAETVIGWSDEDDGLPIIAVGAGGVDVASELFELRGSTIVTRAPMVPVMMTVNPEIALSDCLFYATRLRAP